ncbi:MAG: MFS transporter [Ignavibacteria bacterium]|nr:MFS transporter [Ignavibacteria bacterium]
MENDSGKYYIARPRGNPPTHFKLISSTENEAIFENKAHDFPQRIITGTVARTTTEENSGLGFGVYYWMINLGAFLAPLLVSYLKGFSWSYVFIASSAYCALMLIPTLFIFKAPPKPVNTKTLKDVPSSAAMVLGDARFMLMIVVYSGFWILYFQNFGSVLWFLRDFIDATPFDNFFASLGIPAKFDAEYVTIINAGTIILLQVIVSKIVKNTNAVLTIVTGIFFGVLGFLCLAFASNVWIFVLGIVIFSIGEMTAHPKYYSYVGLVAPHDKKAVYDMHFPTELSVVWSVPILEEHCTKLCSNHSLEHQESKTNRNFWLIFAALGIFASFGLLLYNKMFSADTPETNSRERIMMIAVYASIFIIGIGFFYTSVFLKETIAYKTMVQSLIMLLIGGGGLFTS